MDHDLSFVKCSGDLVHLDKTKRISTSMSLFINQHKCRVVPLELSTRLRFSIFSNLNRVLPSVLNHNQTTHSKHDKSPVAGLLCSLSTRGYQGPKGAQEKFLSFHGRCCNLLGSMVYEMPFFHDPNPNPYCRTTHRAKLFML
jgi:hypothetical protein